LAGRRPTCTRWVETFLLDDRRKGWYLPAVVPLTIRHPGRLFTHT